MRTDLPLFPDSASTLSPQVDALYFYLVLVSAFFALLIAVLVIVVAVRYRRRSETARLYFRMNRPPDDAVHVYVVGKQWMWKIQHADGQREINELHVPVGRPVQLTMTTEDVIHSFFFPAFRMKRDVVPGRYAVVWFQATKPGDYQIFCTQYCGTNHAKMVGWVHVLEPIAYQNWVASGGGSESLASRGAKLFQQHACNSCHRPDSLARGPHLQGLYGRPVHLADGRTIVADESYIRESIVNPAAKIVEGFQPIMPTFQGLIDEDGLLALVAYIRSLDQPDAAYGTEMLPPPNTNSGSPRACASR